MGEERQVELIKSLADNEQIAAIYSQNAKNSHGNYLGHSRHENQCTKHQENSHQYSQKLMMKLSTKS